MSPNAPRAVITALAVAASAVAAVLAAPASRTTAAHAVEPGPLGTLLTRSTTDSTVSPAGGPATPIPTLAGSVQLAETRCLRITATTRLTASEAPISADVLIRRTLVGDPIFFYIAGQTHRLDVAGGPGAHSYHVSFTGEFPFGEQRFSVWFRRTVGASGAAVVATSQPDGSAIGSPSQQLTVDDTGPSCHTT